MPLSRKKPTAWRPTRKTFKADLHVQDPGPLLSAGFGRIDESWPERPGPMSEGLHGHAPQMPCNEYRRYFVAGLIVCADAQNNGLRGSRLGFLTN